MSKDTIGHLAKKIGVSVDTIRHYRDMLLIHPEMKENGYYEYGCHDALMIMMVKQLRSMEMSLHDVRDCVENGSMEQFIGRLQNRQQELEKELLLIKSEIDRINEIKQYSEFGINLLNSVNEFEGTDIYSIASLNTDGVDVCKQIVEIWVKHFPFTYISINIPLDELADESFEGAYSTAVGVGSTKKYIEKFSLPLSPQVHKIPKGRCVRTCIAIEDVCSINAEALSHLKSYVKGMGYRFCHHASGRLLFVESSNTVPLYYVLIWVRIEPYL